MAPSAVDGFPIKVIPKEELDRMPVYGMHLSADLRSGHSTHGCKPPKPSKRSRDKTVIHAPEPDSATPIPDLLVDEAS